jgi:hypothetical protein
MEKRNKHKPIMVTKDFYTNLEEIRKELGFRTLTKTFEHIAEVFLANKKQEITNDKNK